MGKRELIKKDEIIVGVFLVKYSLLKITFEGHILYDADVDDVIVGGVSVHNSLNDYFNTFRSSFCRTIKYNIEKKEGFNVSMSGGFSGYYD